MQFLTLKRTFRTNYLSVQNLILKKQLTGISIFSISSNLYCQSSCKLKNYIFISGVMQTKPEIRRRLQNLLDQSMKHEGDIAEIDREIMQFENSIFGTGWSEGNIKIGWSRSDIFSQPISTSLQHKDRIFSLSSITSQPSTHLSAIQNQRTAPNEGCRFHKKKKKNIKKSTPDQSYREQDKTNKRKPKYQKNKLK